MPNVARLVIRLALSILPCDIACAQAALPSDPAVVRRVLADTTLVHDLPAQQSDSRLIVDLSVTRGERTTMTSQLGRLTALLRADFAVQRAQGASLVFRTEIDVDTSSHGRMLGGSVSMTSWPYGVLDGHLEYYSAKVIELQVNPDLCPADEKVYGAGFRRAPTFDGRFHGFPMLDSFVVITHRTAPPCLPVSRARVVTALRRQLDRVLPQLDAGSEMHVRAQALDALLAGMSPTERSSDAYLSMKSCEIVVCFAPPDEEGSEQLVVPNPDFYDRSRPTTVQAVALALPSLLAPSNPVNEFHARFIRAVLDGFDWPALGALVQ